jgi:hypothetical protein
VNVHIYFYDLFTKRDKAFKIMKELIGKKHSRFGREIHPVRRPY